MSILPIQQQFVKLKAEASMTDLLNEGLDIIKGTVKLLKDAYDSRYSSAAWDLSKEIRNYLDTTALEYISQAQMFLDHEENLVLEGREILESVSLVGRILESDDLCELVDLSDLARKATGVYVTYEARLKEAEARVFNSVGDEWKQLQ